jgi:hypothetical protein
MWRNRRWVVPNLSRQSAKASAMDGLDADAALEKMDKIY